MRFSRKKNSRFSRQVKQSFSRNQEALIEQQRVQLKVTEKNLSTLRKQFQALFERTADAMMILENGAFTDGNPACLELYGCRNRAEFLGVHPSELSPPTQEDGQPSRDKADEMIRLAVEKGSHRFEWLHQTRQGKVFPAEVLLTVVGEGKVPAICAIVRDITERKRIEKEIRFHADYDNLTGLPNRRLILDRIEQSLASSRRHGFFNALLFVDLDRFKFINDSLGHSLGDQLLVQIADSLRQHIREEDTVSRFGGDEFLILLKHLGKDREVASLRAERMAEGIRQSISRAYDINEHSVFATASIGIYLFPDEEEGLDDIIKQADTAMYSAKDTGRNRVAFFQTKMQEAVVKRLHLEKELPDAVKAGQIVPFFQPQISSEGKIIGVEALARWHHPERGFVPPDEFIAIAEDIGIIHELGDQILRSSLEQTLGLRKCLSHLSVNISPNQFRHPDFHDTIAGLISHHDIPEQFLTLDLNQ